MMNTKIFFILRQNGKGKSLFAVPGQMLTSRTAVIDDCMTHGCESVRKKFPAGTVFAAPREQVKYRNGCYHVLTLIPILLPSGEPASDDIFISNDIAEYKTLTGQQ